jgi:DNA-binding FadR family transcriptional regulator
MKSQADSGEALYETTWAFHTALAEIAGNPVMAKLVRILYEMVHERQLNLYWPHIDPQEEIESHVRLLHAICEGEAEAEAEMRQHIDRVARIIEQAVNAGARTAGQATGVRFLRP